MNPDLSLPLSAGSEVSAAARPLRVVAIGGGTGLSTLLRGLRRHVSGPGLPSAEPSQIADLAAVVTVTDDGGSSGRLRKDFNMLPPGDLRNCMVALSEEEDVLTRLFAHRFRSGDSLGGHNFGNLFVAALTEITGDFGHAIQLASKILATRGRIYPVTTANATLDAIERADLITVGPGSLYTSLITNLLVKGIPSALACAPGVRVYICNLMTQANESLGLTASEHIERIYEHTHASIFDYAIVNTAPFSPQTLARYAVEQAAPIEADIERIEALGVRCVTGDFALEENVVRHAASRVTGALLALGRAAVRGSA